MKKVYILFLLIILGCKKELDIEDFSFNFSSYKPEIRIEALILPADSTAIVRIDKSVLINDTDLYDCIDNDYGTISLDSCNSISGAIWHGSDGDLIADCGDWNPLIHDTGIDGIVAKDNNGNGKFTDFGDTAPDEDGSEGNGLPDCGEPNVDSFVEILPNIHEESCKVEILKSNDNVLNGSCNLVYNSQAGNFFNNKYTRSRTTPIFENIESISYGAYIPDANCSNTFWIDYSAEYEFYADCSDAGYGIITSNQSIKLPRPVIFFDEQDVEANDILNCDNYSCLESSSSIWNGVNYDSLYFARYAPDRNILWSSIIPDITFQVVQYMLDERSNQFFYYHGHAGFGYTNNDIVAFSAERIVTEFYDGLGNAVWDAAELRTDNESECIDVEYKQDFQGGYCDTNGNGKWDDEELYADSDANGNWSMDEYFIDLSDEVPDVDIFYYEILTFSESYRNYYFYDQLFLDDLKRTNLRDENGSPIMGAFGAMTSNKIYFRIIDCTPLDKDSCEDSLLTKSVCSWSENISLKSCDIDFEGSICLPSNFLQSCD